MTLIVRGTKKVEEKNHYLFEKLRTDYVNFVEKIFITISKKSHEIFQKFNGNYKETGQKMLLMTLKKRLKEISGKLVKNAKNIF